MLSVEARTPGIVLADELAHTNATESCLMVDQLQPWELACMFCLALLPLFFLVPRECSNAPFVVVAVKPAVCLFWLLLQRIIM